MEEINIDIFADEIKERTIISQDGSSHKWMYIGLLIVPQNKKQKLLNDLMIRRCKNRNNWINCSNACRFHEKNGIEIHYNKLSSKDIYFIAKSWMEYFVDDKSNTYFYLLGIETTKLNNNFFGNQSGNKRYETIYNRFFRMAVKKSVKTYFIKYDKIIIHNIFHDKATIENHDKFPWHICSRLPENDEKISIKSNEIKFIDSNHIISNDINSHFIQYVDLIMGLFYNTFHAESKHKHVEELSDIIFPVTSRLINKPLNRNSSYQYFNRLSIDFFPKNYITTENNLENEAMKNDSFYKKREMKITSKEQLELF